MSDGSGAVIQTESLTKIYAHSHIALNCVDMAVEAGSVLGILGQNGAGKTTLVRLLMGLQNATAGRVYIQGRRMTPNSASLRRQVGYLPGEMAFPPGQNAIDYLDFVGRLYGMPRRYLRPRLAMLLRAVDLLRAAGDPIRCYSVGMQARLAIAASLVHDPAVLIWDEPSKGLDPTARRSLLELVTHLAEAKTLLLCSHSLADLQQVCTEVMVLHQGQVIFRGGFEELSQNVRPHQVEMALTGDRKEISATARSLQDLEELEECVIHRNQLSMRIRESASHSATLANVLVTLADHKLEVTDLRVGGSETEQILNQLITEEGNRGFVRAHQPTME